MALSYVQQAGAARRSKQRAERRALVGRVLLYTLVGSLSLVFAMPLLWMISTSLKTDPQVYTAPPIWLPNPIRWANYPEALFTKKPFLLYTWNTIRIAIPSVIGAVVSCSLVAYGFARIRFPGRDALFFICVATMMVPFQVRMISLYIIFRNLDWLDSFKPLVVPHFFAGAYFVFMLRQFFMTIPQELSEAARIDGCKELGIYWWVILPLAKPALAVVGLFTFRNVWNNFVGPLIYINHERLFPISLALRGFYAQYSEEHLWQYMMAASAATTAPMILIFFLTQRAFVEGISVTGIKG